MVPIVSNEMAVKLWSLDIMQLNIKSKNIGYLSRTKCGSFADKKPKNLIVTGNEKKILWNVKTRLFGNAWLNSLTSFPWLAKQWHQS